LADAVLATMYVPAEKAMPPSSTSSVGTRAAQVFHFKFGPVEVLLVVSAGRLVNQRGYRCVVITVAGPDGIGFAGFAEFLQGVLGRHCGGT
jgi:hypothetical protein